MDASDLNVSVDRMRDWPTVVVDGEVDEYTAGWLRDVLDGMIDNGERRIALDLSGLRFIDSAGLGVLVRTLKRLHNVDGHLRLDSPSRGTYRLLEITGLTRVFDVGRPQGAVLT